MGKIEKNPKKKTTLKSVVSKHIIKPDFPSVVKKVMERLNDDRDNGVGYIKTLIDQDFEELKSKLDPLKPLVVIITTHGSLNNRQNDTFFNRVVEFAEDIKRTGIDWLKRLTESDEREQIKATYVKANIDGYYQEYCPAAVVGS